GFSVNRPLGPVFERTKKFAGYPHPANLSANSTAKRMKTGRAKALTQRNTFCFHTVGAGGGGEGAPRGVPGFVFLFIYRNWHCLTRSQAAKVLRWLPHPHRPRFLNLINSIGPDSFDHAPFPAAPPHLQPHPVGL